MSPSTHAPIWHDAEMLSILELNPFVIGDLDQLAVLLRVEAIRRTSAAPLLEFQPRRGGCREFVLDVVDEDVHRRLSKSLLHGRSPLPDLHCKHTLRTVNSKKGPSRG